MKKEIMIDAISAIDHKYIIEYVQYETKLSIIKSRKQKKKRSVLICAACLALVVCMLAVSLPLSFIVLGSEPVQEWGSEVIENVLFPLDQEDETPDDPDESTPPKQSLLQLNWIEWKFTENLFNALGAGTDDSVIDRLQASTGNGLVGESMQDLGDFLARLYEYYLEHKDEIDASLGKDSNDKDNSFKQTYELDGCTYLFNEDLQSYELEEVFYLAKEKQGVLQIPDQVDGYPVVKINKNACIRMTSITKVIMPDTVKSIEMNAFKECENLVEIQFSSQLEKIGDSAFASCECLEEISLPESLRVIGNNSFENSGLKEITLPEGMTTVENFAFFNCLQLKTVIFPESLTEIGESAFLGTSISHIYIPPMAQLKIGMYAFDDVISVDYGGTVQSWCNNIVAEIPAFGDGVLVQCANGQCYAEFTTGLSYTYTGDTYKSYNIKAGYAITNTEETKDNWKIIIPTYVDSSDKCVIGIDHGAFMNYDKLERLYMSDSVKIIAYDAFMGCDALFEVRLSQSLIAINFRSFEGCTSLQTISIPVSVKIIDSLAFSGCTQLKMIEYQGTLEEWKQIDLAANAFDKGVTIRCTDGEIIIE